MTPKLKKIAHVIIAGTMNWQLRRFLKSNPQIKIVAVTGSVGKTTTKLAIAKVLERKYKVLAHPGNYNSDTGVPLSVFELESPGNILNLKAWAGILWEIEKRRRRPFRYDIIVQELGASRGTEIRYFEYLHPAIGVVTAAKPAHLEGFGDIETIVKEKYSLAQYSQQALICAEDDRLMAKLKQDPVDHPLTYGIKHGDYRYDIASYDAHTGFDGTVVLKDGRKIEAHLTLVAEHNAQSAVAAAAVGDLLGVGVADIKAGLEAVRPVQGRVNPVKGKHGALIIDDTYNASPEAVIASLNMLYSMDGRKIAILGGMNEMGKYHDRYHKEVGGHLGKLDLLVTVADFAQGYIEPAKKSGLKDSQIKSFPTPYEAGEYVAGILKTGDKVLVKGSQGGIFGEEATAKLLENPDDAKQLVRQSQFWQGVKHRTFEEKRPTAED